MKLNWAACIAVLGCLIHFSVMAEELNLRCNGEGTYPESETSRTYGDKKKSGGAETTYTLKKRTVRGFARFALGNYSAKLKLPQGMLPLFSNEDDAGWLKVDELKVGNSEIRGVVDLGTFASADLVIDRKTGDMTMDDGGNRSFIGICAKESVEEGNKF